MSIPEHPSVVKDDVVVSIDYTLTVDGQVIDSTEGDQPLDFLQGHQNIIPGLENALEGMKVGQSKTVTIPADQAYGEVDQENIIDVPRSEFPPEIPLEAGTELEVKNSDGEVLTATIASVTNDSVKLDFNHPLAGKTLTFNVKVVGLREPSDEELEHGHVHDDDFDEEEDEDFEDELEYDEEIDEEEDDELSYEDLDDEFSDDVSDHDDSNKHS